MQSRITNDRQWQRGFTLMEILVAMAIFTTVFIVALLLYDQSNRVFQKTNESAEMQQNTRVAFDKLVQDLRMSGFDYKRAGTPKEGVPSPWAAGRDYNIGTLVTPATPNGHVYRCISAHTSAGGEPTWTTVKNEQVLVGGVARWQESGVPIYEQPDEQIEYLHTAAVTIRGNFDYNDPASTDNGRETDLENSTLGRFPMVTTGNDEIVTYALVSRSGNPSANKDSISFFADVNDGGTPARLSYPGGEPEREIKISGVDLTNKYPPYTLMRYTLDAKGIPVETALADNIRSMEFTYFENAQATRPLTDLLGAKVTDLGGAGLYDPATPGDIIEERLIRSKVRSVTVNITGMSPQLDRDYTHPTDTAFPNYRTFELQSTIVGRNLGLKGIPQSDTNPPAAPTVTAVCSGYCGVALVLWSASEGASDVTYSVLYDTDESGSFGAVLPAGDQTSYAVDLTQLDMSATYYFKVMATNSAGSTLSTNTVKAEVKNATKPQPPTITAVTGSGVSGSGAARPNEIEITWKSPAGVASGTTSCDPSGTAPIALAAAELKGARIFRSKTAGFDIGDPGVIEIMNEDSPGAVTDGSGTWKFTDTTVANCETYYYRVQAVEWCGLKDADNTTGDLNTGLSDFSSEFAGQATTTVKPKTPANFKADVTSVCSEGLNQCYPVKLNWDKVTQDVNNDPIVIEDYLIYRQRKRAGTLDGPKALAGSISDGATTFSEPTFLEEHHSSGDKYTYEYTLVATHCSLDSAAAALTFPGACMTDATLIADLPATGSGTFEDPFKGVITLTITAGSKPLTLVEVSVDGSPFAPVPAVSGGHTMSWVDSEDGHVAKAEFRVTTADCTEVFGVYVQNDPPPCAVEATLSNVAGIANQLELSVKNITSEVVTIDNFDIAWSGQTGFTWNSVKLPSGVTPVATGTPGAARIVTFTPSVATDKTIAVGATYKVVMNFTGVGFAYGGSVTSFRLRYKQPSTGTSPLECAPSLVPCSVKGTTSAGASTYNIVITNNSAEEITVQKFTITYSNQNKWQWNSVTIPSGIINLATPSEGSTETFTVSEKIAAGSTMTIAMNMAPNKPSPPTLDVTKVGIVTMEYTSPLSAGTVLKCRAQ